MSQGVGRVTLACCYLCSALVAAPLLYWSLVTNGDAYHFLALVLLALIAGFILFVNSLVCLVRYRNTTSASLSLVFIFVSVAGVLIAWYFLPQFRM